MKSFPQTWIWNNSNIRYFILWKFWDFLMDVCMYWLSVLVHVLKVALHLENFCMALLPREEIMLWDVIFSLIFSLKIYPWKSFFFTEVETEKQDDLGFKCFEVTWVCTYFNKYWNRGNMLLLRPHLFWRSKSTANCLADCKISTQIYSWSQYYKPCAECNSTLHFLAYNKGGGTS